MSRPRGDVNVLRDAEGHGGGRTWRIHVHTGEHSQMFPLLIVNGITGVRDAFSSSTLATMARWRREILAGTRVGPPRQILSGAGIDEKVECTPPASLTGHVCVGRGDSAAARALVDTLKAAGADMIKTYDLSRELYFTIAAEARRVGIPFGGHLGGHLGQVRAGMQVASALEAADSGARLIDHVNSSGGLNTLCFGPQATAERCRPVADRFRATNTWWISTLTHRLAFNGATVPNPGARARAIVARLTQVTNAYWADTLPNGNWLRETAAPADSLGFFRVAHQVELPMLAGTDAAGGSWDETPGFALHAELAIYVAEGLTPLAALRAATLDPARMWHATDSLGTVAPGKLADLVLLDADPLADITNTTTIRAVVANGRYYDRAALDELLVQARTGTGEAD